MVLGTIESLNVCLFVFVCLCLCVCVWLLVYLFGWLLCSNLICLVLALSCSSQQAKPWLQAVETGSTFCGTILSSKIPAFSPTFLPANEAEGRSGRSGRSVRAMMTVQDLYHACATQRDHALRILMLLESASRDGCEHSVSLILRNMVNHGETTKSTMAPQQASHKEINRWRCFDLVSACHDSRCSGTTVDTWRTEAEIALVSSRLNCFWKETRCERML
jgi:hypothetical protein